MGRYFNPGNVGFRKDCESNIYVDKTEILRELNKVINTSNNCISVSHARRFGKSQAARMIDAYYSMGCDSKCVFDRLKISKDDNFETNLNKYNVIHVDMSSIADFHKEDLVEECKRRICKDIKKVYGDKIDYDEDINTIIYDVYDVSNVGFVIVIDEWDCVIRNFADDKQLVHRYMQFLHSIFKSEESNDFLALGYITGILPVKKIKDESALNNFREYTMIESDNFTPYFGFTENEVKELCLKYDMGFDSIKEWYNGYKISGEHMYNPNSVCEAMTRHRIDSYWKNTSSFKTLSDLITLDKEGLKDDVINMLGRKNVPVAIGTFKNDLSTINSKDDVLTALIHLGYLGYDRDERAAYMPNFEVAQAYSAAIETGNWDEVAKSIRQCDELLKATIRKDENKVAKLLELAHKTYASVITYNNENALSCTVMMAYFTAPAYYTVKRELPTGTGFADIAMIPRADAVGKPAIIVELKWDKTADTAIKQIKNRKYGGELKGYGDEILLVGINYDKNDENKKHECVIESIRL